jgi:NDP-sugar pyrophosphorylase family protein
MESQGVTQASGNRAVILAGGQGTRLKPYTTLFPKALAPLEDMPVLELVLRQLKAHGFTKITLAVGHLSGLIQAYFGNGDAFGVEITYAQERQPLGTAGPLKTLTDLPENFLVMNADIVSDIDFRALYNFHEAATCAPQTSASSNSQYPCLATIAAYQRTSKIDFGVLELAQDSHRIQQFIEKPVLTHSVSMGIYIFNRRICDFIPDNTFFGFDQLVKTLIAEGANQPGRTLAQAYPFEGYWLDIGRVDDYENAVNDFRLMRNRLLPLDESVSKSLPNKALTDPSLTGTVA